MDAFLAVVAKREVREYDERPIPGDARRRILEAGRLAGSSRNRQARRFVVLSDHEAVAGCIWSPENARGAALIVAITGSGFDAGRAAQNMMLAALNDGIGSCPNGISNAGAMTALAGEDVTTVLTFGYPRRPPRERTADDWIRRADRLPFDEVVSER